MSNSNNKPIVWGVSASPYVQKIMVALAEKNIAYELRETLPTVLLHALNQTVPLEFEQASLLGKIPALQIDDYAISDSAIIAGYLDLKFSSGNALYPRCPEAYATARWFEMYSDTVLTNTAYQKIFIEAFIKPNVLNQVSNTDLVDHAISTELPPLLDFLDSSLKEKEWFAGEDFSMADIAITTQLLALETCGFYLSQTQHPNLSDLMIRAYSRHSFDFLNKKQEENTHA